MSAPDPSRDPNDPQGRSLVSPDKFRRDQVARSRVDAGTKTEAGPLGRVDPAHPAPAGTVQRPPLGLATMTIVVGLAGLVAVLVVFGFLAEAIRAQDVFLLDTWANPFLHSIESPGLDAIMNTFTTIGTSWVIAPIFMVTLVVLARRHRYGDAAFLAVATLGGVAIEWTMKIFFARPRPQLAWARIQPDYSFPSGHTMNSTVFYVALALLIWSVFGRRAGLVAMAVAVLLTIGVGVSRVYLGYHYVTDVVGGVLAGTAWLMVVGYSFRLRPTWWSWGRPVPTDSLPVPTGSLPAAAGPPDTTAHPPDGPGAGAIR